MSPSRLNAISLPSGDQSGSESYSGPLVRRVGADPFELMTKISSFPSGRKDVYAIFVPSGDQVGYSSGVNVSSSTRSSSVRARAFLPFALRTQIDDESQSPRATISLLPSGDHVGQRVAVNDSSVSCFGRAEPEASTT